MTVRFLETSFDLYESAGADLRTLMASRLNLSACFSEAEMPEESLQHAVAAVALGGQLIASGGQQGDKGETAEGAQAPLTLRPDDYAMLAVAYPKLQRPART